MCTFISSKLSDDSFNLFNISLYYFLNIFKITDIKFKMLQIFIFL